MNNYRRIGMLVLGLSLVPISTAFADNAAGVDDSLLIQQAGETNFKPSFTSGPVWGIEFSATQANILEWDPIAKVQVNSFPTNCVAPFCNGRGLAHDGTDLWYTLVAPTSFAGEGIIHRVATTGGPDLGTIPDPYGPLGRGIGAMDMDPVTSNLLAISYLPLNNLEEVTRIDPSTGAVLARCDVPFGGGGAGTETLVVDPVARTFLTNAGEPIPFLDEYNLPLTNVPGTPCTLVSSYNPMPLGVGGVDIDSAGALLVHNLSSLNDLGVRPFNVIQDSFNTGGVEDITTAAEIIIDDGPVGGEFLPIDTTALLVAGVQTNIIWILTALAGIASVAFGALYLTVRRN